MTDTPLLCDLCGDRPAEWRVYTWTENDLPASHACDPCHRVNRPVMSVNKARKSWRRIAGTRRGQKDQRSGARSPRLGVERPNPLSLSAGEPE